MNMRLKKVLDDIQKTEDKILELQEYVKKLKIQKKQMEDAEIIKAIRSSWTAGNFLYCLMGFRKERLRCSLMRRAIFPWIIRKQEQ